MAVKARLDGHAFDLETLARLFDHGDVRVESDDQGYYLTSPDLISPDLDAGKAVEAARAAVGYVNGAARVLAAQFEPVRATGTYLEQTADGSGIAHHVVQVDSVRVRSMVGTPTIVVNGVVSQPPPSPAPDYVKLAQTDADVRDVLRILGKPVVGLNWFDLYKVWEVVSKNVGGWRAVVAKGWISQDDFEAFQASAHHQGVSGDAARHARDTRPIPARVLSMHEGRDLIRQLVATWLPTV